MPLLQTCVVVQVLFFMLATAPVRAQAPGPGELQAAQAQFRLVAQDLGSVATYKSLLPSGSAPTPRFGVAIAVQLNQIVNRDAFALAAGGGPDAPPVPAALTQYALRIDQGLPYDLYVGANVSNFVGAAFQVAGGELRWVAVRERGNIPGLSLRVAGSRLSGIDQLALTTASYDVSLSKRFAFVTPYAGVGQVRVNVTPNVPGLQAEAFNVVRVFAGTNIGVKYFNFLVEVDKTGEAANMGMKLGLQF